MKFLRFAALAVLVAATPVIAGNVTGDFHAPVPGGTMSIQVDALTVRASGAGSGTVYFHGPVKVSDTDEEGAPRRKAAVSELTLKVDVDCVRINKNRATMSGVVRDSNLDAYLGRRFLLVVEDNASPANPKFTWGLYRTPDMKWTPSDTESSAEDEKSPKTWVASDSERDDDEGVKVNEPGAESECRSLLLSVESLIEIPAGGGTVRVQP